MALPIVRLTTEDIGFYHANDSIRMGTNVFAKRFGKH
jgi:hypothetical protein